MMSLTFTTWKITFYLPSSFNNFVWPYFLCKGEFEILDALNKDSYPVIHLWIITF